MLKRSLVLLCCAMAFASCLKESSPDDTYDFIENVDTEGIKLFMTTRKVVETKDGPVLEKTTPDDPQNMWNTRRTEEITENTPYADLQGHAFQDTAKVKFVNEKGDTLSVNSGVWVYVNKRGTATKRPTDSCAVLVKYAGTLLSGSQFDVQPSGVIMYLYTGTITGFRLGMKYFEHGRIVTETIVPEPGEDGKQDPPYEQTSWKDGGQGWIIIPSRTAYGNILTGDIPPNSVLVFTIDLLAISDLPADNSGSATITINGKEAAPIWVNTPPADKIIKAEPKKK